MGLADAIQYFAKTDVGRHRDLNEDNFLVDKGLALSIVADGMGGHAAGEVASAIAVRIIHQEVRKRADFVRAYGAGQATRDGAREIQHVMESAVLRACSRVHEEAKADTSKRGMGTTLSSLLVTGSHGFVAHVGDSRIYLYRGGKVQQVTEDHTVYNELIRRGRLTREQIEKVAQKNAVTRAVGVYERVDVDTLMLDLLPGDQFLLASDGLHGYINHVAELEPYFEDEDGERASNELIDLANKKGGKDNITCVLVRVGRADTSTADQARRLSQKREALRNMPLFSKLQERELLRVIQIAEALEFKAGEDVVREGDRGDELFIVTEGQLQILRGEQVLSEVGPGEHFGEMALIRSTPRSATVRALENSQLIAIRRSDFFAILRKEYELAVKLLWQFLGVLADRLDQTSRDLSSAKEELAAEDISDVIAEDPEDAAGMLAGDGGLGALGLGDTARVFSARGALGSKLADAIAAQLAGDGAPASKKAPASVAPGQAHVAAAASTGPASAGPSAGTPASVGPVSGAAATVAAPVTAPGISPASSSPGAVAAQPPSSVASEGGHSLAKTLPSPVDVRSALRAAMQEAGAQEPGPDGRGSGSGGAS